MLHQRPKWSHWHNGDARLASVIVSFKWTAVICIASECLFFPLGNLICAALKKMKWHEATRTMSLTAQPCFHHAVWLQPVLFQQWMNTLQHLGPVLWSQGLLALLKREIHLLYRLSHGCNKQPHADGGEKKIIRRVCALGKLAMRDETGWATAELKAAGNSIICCCSLFTGCDERQKGLSLFPTPLKASYFALPPWKHLWWKCEGERSQTERGSGVFSCGLVWLILV